MDKSASFWLAAAAAAREDKINTNADYSNDTATASQTAFPRSRLPGNNEIDIIIFAGGRPFPSNKAILSQHSEYFKATLQESLYKSCSSEKNAQISNINLPTIPHEYFAILLSGIHSPGNFKELLNAENIYQVLLYSQLLQIPTCVSQSREFLTELYVNERKLNKSVYPVSSITSISDKSSTYLPEKLFHEHTLQSSPQKLGATKVIKPIPRPPPLMENPHALNHLSSADLSNFWKPWIQQYQETLRLPLNIRGLPHLIPLQALQEEERRRTFPDLFMKDIEKGIDYGNIEEERSVFPYSRPPNTFSGRQGIENPYLTAAVAMNSTLKNIPTSFPVMIPKKNDEEHLDDDKVKNKNEHLTPSKSSKTLSSYDVKFRDKDQKSDDRKRKLHNILFPKRRVGDQDESNYIGHEMGSFLKSPIQGTSFSIFGLQNLFRKPNSSDFSYDIKGKPNDMSLTHFGFNEHGKEKNGNEDIDMANLEQEHPKKSAKENILGNDKINSNFSHLDVAACDGPVRFQKVLNSMTRVSQESKINRALKRRQELIENKHPNDVNESILDLSSESLTGEIYECPYCSHIFKSHYCYQKHKRRHINPFTSDFCTNQFGGSSDDESKKMDLHASKNSFSCIKEARVPKGSDNKANTVLKDINVQFFPCKICGAKFPSYYFVHKHKKMWHTDEAADNENELEVSNQEYTEHSSRSIKLDKN